MLQVKVESFYQFYLLYNRLNIMCLDSFCRFNPATWEIFKWYQDESLKASRNGSEWIILFTYVKDRWHLNNGNIYDITPKCFKI